MRLAEAREEYLDYLVVERGSSPNTVDAYGRDVARYVRFLQDEGITDADAAKARHPLPRKKEGGAAKPSALAAQDYSQRAYTGDMINLFEDDEEGDKP